MKIYSSKSCHACEAAKKQLQEYKIDFEEIDVTKLTTAEQVELGRKAGYLSLPILESNGKFFHDVGSAIKEMK